MARYQVLVVTPFLYAGRQVVSGEVLELTATEALCLTYARRVRWNTSTTRPRAVPPRKKKRRPAPAVA